MSGRADNPALRRRRPRIGWRRPARAGVVLALLVCVAGAAAAQPAPDPADVQRLEAAIERARREKELDAAWLAAFRKDDLEGAERHLSELARLRPGDPLANYNLACVLALRGKVPEGEAALVRAVEAGFTDFFAMRRDPHLANLRTTETFQALAGSWRAVQDAVIDARIARELARRGPGYTAVKDEALRLAYVSAFPEATLAGAREEIARLARWWESAVLPEGETAMSPEADRPDAWVVVLLPTRRDFDLWAAQALGSRAGSVGGIYDHDRKELVAQNTGATLRHEFLHVLHWRHMARTGKVQPSWIHEGLCSLVEDIETAADGSITPVASWRTNTVRNMARIGNLPRFADLFGKRADEFVQKRALANYAAARGLFLFLHQQGKLRAWYGQFVADEADETGAAALERVFGKPLAEIEKEFRAWARALPEAPDASRTLKVGFSFDLQEEGDGLKVSTIVADRGAGGLRLGDVLFSLDGAPTRDLHDLSRALAGKKPGETVEVEYRRGTLTGRTKVRLGGVE